MSFPIPMYPAMQLLKGFQQQFLHHIEAGGPEADNEPPLDFHHNLQQTLVQALCEIYSASRALLGDAFFVNLVSHYLRRFPPSIHRLDCFGSQMPTFVGSFTPARHQVQLPELVRLEWAVFEACQAESEDCFNHSGFAEACWRQPGTIRLHLAPGLTLLQASYAVDLLWQHHKQRLGAAGLKYLDHGDVRLAILVREGRLRVERLNLGCWVLLQQIRQDGRYSLLTGERDEAHLEWTLARGWVSRYSLSVRTSDEAPRPVFSAQQLG